MYISADETNEFINDEYTDSLFESICFDKPIDPDTYDDVIEGIEKKIDFNDIYIFREGVADRLTQLGTACSAEDTDIMLAEVKCRYKQLLDKPCPRTVQEWIKGTTPGTTNRQNNYELCYALEMDYKQTRLFFQKCFLTLPFNVKSKTDAVFMYALYHNKPYSVVKNLLTGSKGFVSQQYAHTSTSQIAAVIFQTDDDEKFLEYLSTHCYDNEQQFQLARSYINKEISLLKTKIVNDDIIDTVSPNRLNSRTISELLGYKYQLSDKKSRTRVLPKRFTESLPNDVTLGKIINGETASYELLRKTLMLLKFYNFYSEAENTENENIYRNLLDFFDELNAALTSCGFAQIYLRNLFDGMLFYCANSYDPILTMHLLNEWN